MQWSKGTVALLRAEYEHAIEELAEQLRPRFEAGELHGFTDDDQAMLDTQTPPLWTLEEECSKLFCDTAACSGGNDPSTFLVMALSPSLKSVWDQGATPEGMAGRAAAWDVLRIALARGWWTPAKDEEPAAADIGTLESIGWGSVDRRNAA